MTPRCRHGRSAVGALGLLLTALMPQAVAAQTVQGLLLDAVTDQPVSSAEVRLLRANDRDETAATAVTDDAGRFLLRAPAPGRYRLRARRIGYEPVTTPPFDLLGGDAPLEVEVRLSAVAVMLAPLTIVSERAPLVESLRLQTAEYYDRKARYGREGLGLGEFLEQEEIRQTNPSRVSDALRMVRGVWVQGGGGRRQVITLRGHGSLRAGGNARCIPQVYLDGAPVATGRDIDELVSPWSLAAIEVYPGLSVPAEFWWYPSSGTEQLELPACGVIVLWTGYGGGGRARREEAASDTAAALDEASTPFALHLTLSSDSVSLRDSLVATLTLANNSDDSVSLCVTDSRYTLRGSRSTKDIVEKVQRGSCVHIVDLAPRESRSWQEILAFLSAVERPGDVLIQKHFRLRKLACGGGDERETRLRSEPRRLALYRGGGG